MRTPRKTEIGISMKKRTLDKDFCNEMYSGNCVFKRPWQYPTINGL